jgi:membrane protein DedA with SNARE-associated domain
MIPLQARLAPTWLESLLTSDLAIVVLLGISILEGAMLLRFMPSELVAPTALTLIGTSLTDITLILTITVVGATIGQTLLFFLVRRAGREYLLQKRWFPLTDDRLERFDNWFDRWGPVAVAGSNTLLFVRGVLTVPAGLSDMQLRSFVTLSTIGTLSFQSILTGLYLLGSTIVV